MNNPIKIGLVDDKAVNRSSFTGKIKEFEDLNLCFVAVNGHDCLEQLKGLPINKIPQVIFMDLEMPEMDGVQTISLARAMYPDIYFIVLTVFDDEDKIFEAIKAGAHGYLLKDESAATLYHSIINVLETGGAPMSPAIARKALEMLGKAQIQTETKAAEPHLLDALVTEREKEVLLHIINGHDSKRIAAMLDISAQTIRKHVAHIYQKLHVNSKAQIISLAHKKNWI